MRLTSPQIGKTYNKERTIIQMHIDEKVLSKILKLQHHIRKVICLDEGEFNPGMQGWVNILRSINVN